MLSSKFIHPYRVWRRSRPAWAVLFLLLVAACSSGGGGDGAPSDEPAPAFPASVKYVAGGPGGDPGTTGMVLGFDNGVSVNASFYVEGNYVPATRGYTLNAGPVPRLSVLASGLSFTLPIVDSFGGFGLLVDDTLQWRFGDHPTAGVFRLIVGNAIRVAVNNNIGGVDIALVEFGDTVASTSLTWAQLEAAYNDDAQPPYVRQAAFGYLVLQRLYDPIDAVIRDFNVIRDQEGALRTAGSGNPLSVPICAALNGATGTFDMTWQDGPGDFADAVGGGDSFAVGVNGCWVDDTAVARDLLYDSGTEQLANYAESSTPFILGFDDVTLSDLRLTETRQAGGSVTTGAGVTYNTFSNVSGRSGFLLSLTAALSGILNSGNYIPVASASATAITLPGELGSFVRNELADALAGAPSGTEPCSAGGSYDYTRSDPFGAGSTMTVTFNNCVQGIAGSTVTINGSYTLTATAFVSIDNLTFTLVLTSVTTQDNVGTTTVDGQMSYQRNGPAEVSASIAGQNLMVSNVGVTGSLSNFSISGTRASSSLTLGAPGETFTLQVSGISDPLAGSIITPFSGSQATALQSGGLRVTAPDGGNVLLTITDSTGRTTVALDSDGNGTVDETTDTTWDDLY